MLPLLLDEMLIQVGNLFRNEVTPLWKEGDVTSHDLTLMRKEAAVGAQFDTAGFKRNVMSAYDAGEFRATCKECDFGRVVAILPPTVSIPTKEWGRIFQWFGRPPRGGSRWQVYWFGAAVSRQFPQSGQPLERQHLNGGYTMACSTDGIFIYRLEEATRVLIHELLHAACLDPPNASIPVREATVETWAELLLIAYRAKGMRGPAARLLDQQLKWVADTNHRAEIAHSVKGEADYGWRYLNGRTAVYRSLGIELPAPSRGGLKHPSSRFTHPALGD